MPNGNYVNGRRNCKYMWASREMDNWSKMQAQKLRHALGAQVSTADVTRLVHDRILVPNQVDLTKLIKKKIQIKRRII